jgi:hypothetical protein
MAYCYNCGKFIEGQGYKREVQTGSGVRVGMRRMNYSARIYYSIRTVCKDCADKLDSANVFGWVLLIVLASVAVIILISITQNNNSKYPNNTSTSTSSKYFDNNNGESVIYSKPNINSIIKGKIKDFNNFKKIGETKFFDKYEYENSDLVKIIGFIKKEDLY